MAEVIHERRIGEPGYGPWIAGAILIALLLVLAWWLFWSSSSPIPGTGGDTNIIQQAPPAQDAPDTELNVTPPPTEQEQEGDTNIVIPPGSTQPSTAP